MADTAEEDEDFMQYSSSDSDDELVEASGKKSHYSIFKGFHVPGKYKQAPGVKSEPSEERDCGEKLNQATPSPCITDAVSQPNDTEVTEPSQQGNCGENLNKTTPPDTAELNEVTATEPEVVNSTEKCEEKSDVASETVKLSSADEPTEVNEQDTAHTENKNINFSDTINDFTIIKESMVAAAILEQANRVVDSNNTESALGQDKQGEDSESTANVMFTTVLKHINPCQTHAMSASVDNDTIEKEDIGATVSENPVEDTDFSSDDFSIIGKSVLAEVSEDNTNVDAVQPSILQPKYEQVADFTKSLFKEENIHQGDVSSMAETDLVEAGADMEDENEAECVKGNLEEEHEVNYAVDDSKVTDGTETTPELDMEIKPSEIYPPDSLHPLTMDDEALNLSLESLEDSDFHAEDHGDDASDTGEEYFEDCVSSHTSMSEHFMDTNQDYDISDQDAKDIGSTMPETQTTEESEAVENVEDAKPDETTKKGTVYLGYKSINSDVNSDELNSASIIDTFTLEHQQKNIEEFSILQVPTDHTNEHTCSDIDYNDDRMSLETLQSELPPAIAPKSAAVIAEQQSIVFESMRPKEMDGSQIETADNTDPYQHQEVPHPVQTHGTATQQQENVTVFPHQQYPYSGHFPRSGQFPRQNLATANYQYPSLQHQQAMFYMGHQAGMYRQPAQAQPIMPPYVQQPYMYWSAQATDDGQWPATGQAHAHAWPSGQYSLANLRPFSPQPIQGEQATPITSDEASVMASEPIQTPTVPIQKQEEKLRGRPSSAQGHKRPSQSHRKPPSPRDVTPEKHTKPDSSTKKSTHTNKPQGNEATSLKGRTEKIYMNVKESAGPQEHSLFVKGLNPKTPISSLVFYFEICTKMDVIEEKIIYNYTRTNALVVVSGKQKPDIEQVRKEITRKHISDHRPEVNLVDPYTRIAVSCIQGYISAELLCLYFEKKSIGGGDVVGEPYESEDGTCTVITFLEPQVAAGLCGRQHQLEGKYLCVSPYYHCELGDIWDSQLHQIVMPEPVEIPLSPIYLVLLRMKCCSPLRELLAETHCRIVFSTTHIELSCTLEPTTAGFRELKSSWKGKVTAHMDTYLHNEVHETSIECSENIWPNMLQFCDSEYSGEQNVLVQCDREAMLIRVAGLRSQVGNVSDEIMTKAKQLEREMSRIAVEISVEPMVVELLDRLDILTGIQAAKPDIALTHTQNMVFFEGQAGDISEAKLSILQFKSKLQTFQFAHNYSQKCVELLQRSKGMQISVTDQFKSRNIVAEWRVMDKDVISTIFQTDHEVSSRSYAAVHALEDHVRAIFASCVVEKKISVQRADVGLFDSIEWTNLQQDMTEFNEGYADWDVVRSGPEIRLFGRKENIDIIEKKIQTFLEENSLHEKIIKRNAIKIRFIKTHMKSFKKDLETQFVNQKVEVNINDETLVVRGTQDGVQLVQSQVNEVCQGIIHEKHSIQDVAVKDVYRDTKNNGKIDLIEQQTRCLIQLPGETQHQLPAGNDTDYESLDTEEDHESMRSGASTASTASGPSSLAAAAASSDDIDDMSLKTSNGITVDIVSGEIGKQSANVIVISSGTNLQLKSGGAGGSILHSAGQQLQDELTRKYSGEIQYAQIACAPGYMAECSWVYVTALPKWNQKDAKKLLYKSVYDSVSMASRHNTYSMAFSTLGCGQLNYPVNVVAETMFQAVVDFDAKHPKSSLKKVNFVIYHKDDAAHMKTFKDELKMQARGYTGQRNVYEIKNGPISIQMTVADLAIQAVDAIICSTSSKMDLTHGACQALLRVGGRELQDQCTQHYGNQLGIGEVAEIVGGKLPCKNILLTVLPQYTAEALQKLKSIMKTCLNLAESRGFKRIALPALGTGNLKYPKKEVCHAMFETVMKWGVDNPNTCVQSVTFVMHAKDHELVQIFRNYILLAKGRGKREHRRLSDTQFLAKGGKSKSASCAAPLGETGFRVHDVSLTVISGDILEQKADGIVTAVGSNFEFMGAVSEALKRKCPTLEAACKNKVGQLKSKGLVRTTGFGAHVKHILHVINITSVDDCTVKIKKCLEKANKYKIETLAIPLLGTGQGFQTFKPDAMSGCMFEAVHQMMAKNSYPKHVTIIVYGRQPELFKPVIQGIRNKIDEIDKYNRAGKISKLKQQVKNIASQVSDVFTGPSEKGVMSEDDRRQLIEAKSTISFHIYSDSVENIRRCKQQLQDQLQQAYTKKIINDYKEIVSSLTWNERKLLDKSFLVDMKIDEVNGVISVRGPSAGVLKATSYIQSTLRKIQEHRGTVKHAEELAKIVRWHYEVVTHTEYELIEYENVVNFKIEMAYRNNDKLYRFNDAEGERYIIDLSKLVEYPESDPEDTLRVIRRDQLTLEYGTLPQGWNVMKDNQNCKMVELKASDHDYITVSNRFIKEATTGEFTHRYQFDKSKLKVTKIARVQNKYLFHQYHTKKKQLEALKPNLPANMPIERELWHGTNNNAVDSIVLHGFNRSYSGNNAGEPWYGQGVYFARDASYSTRGWLSGADSGGKGYIFLAKVLTGQYVLGKKGMRVLPHVAANDPSKKDVLYDSAVNTVDAGTEPMEFIIFHDTQAYPAYLLTFNTT